MAAAKILGMSYKAAWDAVQALNNLFARPLIQTRAGGKTGGMATITSEGEAAVRAFHMIQAELSVVLSRLERHLDNYPTSINTLLWSLGMRTSARNALRGVVKDVTDGAVNAEVTLQIAENVHITAIVTRQSVKDLDLAPGKEAIALIKASFVILALGDNLRTSARNQLSGKVAERQDGAVNTEVTVELTAGKHLTATITKESAQELDLKIGDPVIALIKAPHVILAVE